MVNAIVKTENHKPKGMGWLQIEKKAAREMQQLAMKSPVAMGTLMYMVNNMSKSNALVVSQKAIADELGATREGVNRAIKLLNEHSFIQVIKVGSASVYVVNSKVAWQGNRGERFANFHADIRAVESEQIDGVIDNKENLKPVPFLVEGERYLVGNEEMPPPDQQEMDLP